MLSACINEVFHSILVAVFGGNLKMFFIYELLQVFLGFHEVIHFLFTGFLIMRKTTTEILAVYHVDFNEVQDFSCLSENIK